MTEDEERVGLPSGLWHVPGHRRVIASPARRHGVPMSSRIQPRLTRSGAAVIEERKPAWNPQLVELTAVAPAARRRPAGLGTGMRTLSTFVREFSRNRAVAEAEVPAGQARCYLPTSADPARLGGGMAPDIARAPGARTDRRRAGRSCAHGWRDETPLWLYILKEAKALRGSDRPGPVGGRIVGEVLVGIVDADPGSLRSVDPAWTHAAGPCGPPCLASSSSH